MKVYNGKNSWWTIVFLIIYNISPIIIFLLDNKIISKGWLIVIWCIYYSFNIIWIPALIRNYIELYDDYFIFFYGFSREKIVLRDITKIEKSRNSIASSANSLDRIHIVTKNRDFYISLKHNDEFIEDINHRKQYI